MTAGAAEFRRNRRLLMALVFSAVAYFAFFLYDALIALLTEDFGLGATAFGVGIAASGGGGLVGALAAGRVAGAHPIACMIWAAMFSGCVTVGVAIAGITGFAMPAWMLFPGAGADGWRYRLHAGALSHHCPGRNPARPYCPRLRGG